ncbi:hypothetical protein [Arthrobacter sp. 35W]|uniref:hypothetical protein n=1 Tax=Arthrobacter sp. 35W TaxID=1132441 RepID=UPI0003FEE463|nr:hypothetical protein [Arthrobacter sp. 35W]
MIQVQQANEEGLPCTPDLDEVDAEFKKKLLAVPPGLLLVTHPDVFVGVGAMCGAARIAGDMGALILGLDGYRTDGEHLIPLIEYILDSSSYCTPELTWDDAVQKSVEAVDWVADVWKDGPEFVEFVLLGRDDDPYWHQRLMANFPIAREWDHGILAMSDIVTDRR